MASKLELRQEIEALCQKRGVSVPEGLQGMNFVTLQGELQRLQAGLSAPHEPALADPPGLTKVVPAADPPPPALIETPLGDAQPQEPPPDTNLSPPELPPAPLAPAPSESTGGGGGGESQPTGPFRYFVAHGKMLSNTLRGKIGAFQPVKAKDLPGGEGSLEELFAQGILTRKP